MLFQAILTTLRFWACSEIKERRNYTQKYIIAFFRRPKCYFHGQRSPCLGRCPFVEEFETSDDEEIVFGWKVSVIYTNRTGKMSIDISKYEIGPFGHDDITKVKPYSTCPYCHTDIVLFVTRYIRDEYATEDQIRTTYKKAARDIMAYCEERISSGYKTSQINEFLKSKVERGYFK